MDEYRRHTGWQNSFQDAVLIRYYKGGSRNKGIL